MRLIKDNLRTIRPSSNSHANPRRTCSKCTNYYASRRILLIPRRLAAMFPDTIPHRSTQSFLFVGFYARSTNPSRPVYIRGILTCTLLNNLACTDERIYDAELNSVPRKACFHTRSFLPSFRGESGRVSRTHK